MFATQKGKNIVSKNYMTWTYPLQFCILCHTCSTVYNASKWRHILLSTTVFPKVGFLIGICHIEPFMKTWMDSSSSSIDLAETKTAPLIFCRATQNCEMKIGVVNVMGIQSGTWRWKSPRWWTGTLPTAWNRFVTCPNIAQQCCMTMLKYAQVPQVRFQIFSGLSEASGDAQNVMTTCKFYVSAWPTHHLRGTPLNAHTNTRLVQLGVLRRLWRSIHCFLMNRKNVKSSSSSPPSSPPPPHHHHQHHHWKSKVKLKILHPKCRPSLQTQGLVSIKSILPSPFTVPWLKQVKVQPSLSHTRSFKRHNS